VGPVVERAEADSIKARLEKEQALTGLVVAHP
jgi:cell division septation protein DedD